MCGEQVGVVGGMKEGRNLQTLIFNLLIRDQQGSPTTCEYEVSHFDMATEYPNIPV